MAGLEVKGVFRLGSEIELQALQKRMGTGRVHKLEGEYPNYEASAAKYKNKRIQTKEWGWFDSKKEYERWRELLLLEKAGKITGLERQVKFVLAPAVMIGGRQIPALRFIADFVYIEAGEKVVEDCKSEPTKTRAYKIKRHLMATVHAIAIRET